MNIAPPAAIAIALYVLAAARIAHGLQRRALGREAGKRGDLLLAFTAIALHGLVLYQHLFTAAGVNLGVLNAASLVAWVVTLLVAVGAYTQASENLLVVLLPLTALLLALGLAFPQQHLVLAGAAAGLRAHVVLSLAAYSLLTVAALQALVLAIEERLLRSGRLLAAIQVLPPLQTLETLMFRIIGAGFFILSLSLVSGMMFLKDIFGQHLVHKTVLAFIAWLVFAVLLWGRRRHGWRGRIAIRYTLGGFFSLMLAYFGTKVVLEMILHRV
ncbi:MAG: cytochrome C assembly family protein [Gammaproteobacteria bacterium]